jgi:hypothetical protein
MPTPEIEQALAELRDLTECRCDPAWTERQLHHPECHSGYREDVEVLAVALAPPVVDGVMSRAQCNEFLDALGLP